MDGQFSNPVRVVAFNTAEGWSRDVSEEIADELRQRLGTARSRPTSRISSIAMAAAGRCSCRCP
jgi:hypothetical protein